MNEPIYDFKKLKTALESIGYTISEAKPYVPLEVADVGLSNIESGEVEITNDGIFYVNPNTGSRQQIFLYKKSIYLEYQGRRRKPSMHIVNCEAIKSWGKDSYRRANTGTVLVWDKSSRKEVSVSNLPLCSFCQTVLSNSNTLTTSDDFEKILRESAEKNREREQDTDLFNYPWEWQKISEAYRKKRNYTCEKCGFTPFQRFDKYYIDVHHKDGIKNHNIESNLQCLCVSCHANINPRHQENFSKGANKKRLDAFKRKYPNAGKS